MRNTIVYAALILSSLFVLPACGGKHHKSMAAATTYACPMHPDITGKAGDKCSKCGMDLEAVAAYSCPMHPDITGKEGDKCSKCGMDLTKSDAEEKK